VTYANKERILGEEATVTYEAFAKRAEECLNHVGCNQCCAVVSQSGHVKRAGNLLCVPAGVVIIVAVNGEG
jgi:hypothetical protein